MSNVAVPVRGAAKPPVEEDTISLPLYLCGLIVTWCGIFAVNAVLSNDPFTTETLMLSTCGFLFSLACRRLQIDKRLINYALPLLLISYFGIRLARHSIDILYFIPVEAQQNDNLIAVLLVWASVIRSWMLISDGAVVFTSVTSIAMIGLVGAFNVNADQIIWFTIYTMATLYMVMHQNYLVQKFWLPDAAAASGPVIVRTHFMLCVAIGLAALLIGTALVVPIRMVGSNLSLGQAMRQFFAPNPGSDVTRANSVAFSDAETFQVGTGDGFSSDDTVVMTAHPSDNQEHYWIGRTYDHYSRHNWTSTLTDRDIVDPAPQQLDGAFDFYNLHQYPAVAGVTRPIPPPESRVLQTTFNVMLGRTETVYAPPATYALALRPAIEPQIDQTPDGFVGYESVQQKFRYMTYSDNAQIPMSLLINASDRGIPPFIRQHYLEDRGEDVLTLAEQERLADTVSTILAPLPHSHATPYYKAQAIRDWVGKQCVYSLKVSPVPQDQDAVSYFLFTSHKGYCDLFASSMALLCRYAGLPSRVVTGFAPGSRNQKEGFDIHARDKHAWVEVFFPGLGWYPFDPTSVAAPEPAKSDSGDNMEFFRRVYYFFVNFLNLNGPIPIILFAVIVLCLSYVIKIEVVDRIREEVRMRNKQAILESSAGDQADVLMIETGRHLAKMRYRRMVRTMVQLGMPSRGARTPAAYAQLVHRQAPLRFDPGEAASASAFIAAVDAITEDVIIASYAPDNIAFQLVAVARERRSQEQMELIEQAAKAHRWRLFGGVKKLLPGKAAG